MSSKAEKDKLKQLHEKCQSELHTLLRDEDNKYCVDCDSKGPRWASWNLGVFLCIRCAGIHRNLGVHISKVKSVNLDTWTPEQVVSLQQMGNSRARAVYEANLPDKFRRPQNDSSLETFIRAKYEHKKYIAREWVPPALPEVNWEKEIDEEIEKQKRKKKTVVERMPLGAVEVPQLPKPKNASPKPGRVAAVAATVQPPPIQENKLNTDLLGLQNGDDTFSSFLSAPVQPPTAEKKVEEKVVDPAKSEEESFFNQTAPTEKEKAKLTKDSILALYANTPVNNFTPPTNNFTPPSTNFPSQPNTFSAPTAFNPQTNSFPPSTNFNPTTYNNFPAQQQPQQTFPNFSQFPQQTYPQQFTNQFPNQFNPMPQQTIPQSTNYQFNSQFNPPMQNPQFPVNQFPQTSYQTRPQQTPNPFFNQPSSIQQQFGSLTLNGPYAPSAPPKVATNIWQ